MENNYIKLNNRLLKIHQQSVVTTIIKSQIAKGILPIEYLEFIRKGHDRDVIIKRARNSFNNNIKLKNAILRLYGFKCSRCKRDEHLSVRHIKSIKDFPELACEPTNLRVVCRFCVSFYR